MVGFTPSLSTAVWVGTESNLPIVTAGGGRIYGSGLPSDIWKQTMDGALADTPAEQIGAPAPNPSPVVPAAPQQPSRNPYDILNPPPPQQPEPQQQPTQQQPFIVIPPAAEPYVPEPEYESEPQAPASPPAEAPAPPVAPPPPAPRVVEILPGVTIPVP
jgi:membrane peptidoglycan carboxypeptidase